MPDLIKEQRKSKSQSGKNHPQAELDRHCTTIAKTVDGQLSHGMGRRGSRSAAEKRQTFGRASSGNNCRDARADMAEFAGYRRKTARAVEKLLPDSTRSRRAAGHVSWGILGYLGLNRWLLPIDDATRSPFAPYGFSGIMLGASIVFFAFIGFDSISTHAEEARQSATRRAHRHSRFAWCYALCCISRWRR